MSYFGDQVEQVKARTDLARLAERYCRKVVRAGDKHLALCCFHEERTPSLNLYEDGTYHCFGCGAHGDVVTMVCERDGVGFQEAIERLAKDAGVVLEDQKPQRAIGGTDHLLRVVEWATDLYERALHSSDGEKARAYLTDDRKLTAETIRRHRIGWAPGWSYLVDAARTAGIPIADLVDADLAQPRGRSHSDVLVRRVTIPILDQRGRPIAFTARILPDEHAELEEKGTKVGKYVNSRKTALYDKGATLFNFARARSAAKKANRLLVVEGGLDVIALSQAGHAETVAPCGTALTERHAELVALAAGNADVLLVLDGDAAGRKAAEPAVRNLLPTGVPLRLAFLPEGSDPDDLLVQDPSDDSRAAWTESLAKAQPAVPWLVEHLAGGTTDAAARLRVFDDVVGLLLPIVDADLRELRAMGVAKQLGFPAAVAKRRLAVAAARSLDHAPGEHPPSGVRGPGGDNPPRRYPLNEVGNALRFQAVHGDDVRYCHTWKTWLVWTGTHWAIDDDREIDRRILHAINHTVADEIAELDALISEAKSDARRDYLADRIEDLERWREKCGNDRAILHSISRAEALPALGIVAEQLDRAPHLFTVANGTIDLRDGSLRTHARDDLITRSCPTTYRLDRFDDRWSAFLEDFTGSQDDVEAYLQRACGYAMTGETKEDAFWMFVGTGGNGKGTLTAAVLGALGHYAKPIPFETFLAENATQRRWELAECSQVRLVLCEESQEGKKFNAAHLKEVTGGSPISAARKYGHPFTYKPKFKVWMLTNFAPHANDSDRAFFRRLHMLRCESIPAKPDQTLREYLHDDPAAREAVLAWMVQGARQYYERGLCPPQSVRNAIDEYRQEQDPLAAWLQECHVTGEEGPAIPVRDIRRSYHAWCEANGTKPISDRQMRPRLAARGVTWGHFAYNSDLRRSLPAMGGIRFRGADEPPQGHVAPTPDTSLDMTAPMSSDGTDQGLADPSATPVDGSPSSASPAVSLDNPGDARVALDLPDAMSSDRTPSPDGHLDTFARVARDPRAHTHVRDINFSPPTPEGERGETPYRASDRPPDPDSRQGRLASRPSAAEDLFSDPLRPDGTRLSDDPPPAADDPASGITDE